MTKKVFFPSIIDSVQNPKIIKAPERFLSYNCQPELCTGGIIPNYSCYMVSQSNVVHILIRVKKFCIFLPRIDLDCVFRLNTRKLRHGIFYAAYMCPVPEIGDNDLIVLSIKWIWYVEKPCLQKMFLRVPSVNGIGGPGLHSLSCPGFNPILRDSCIMCIRLVIIGRAGCSVPKDHHVHRIYTGTRSSMRIEHNPTVISKNEIIVVRIFAKI